jgi:hypothetical protein
MKKVILLCMFFVLLLASQFARAQGLENFNNYGETSNVYHDSTFVGQDGSTWHYYQCRGDSAIVAPTPTLGKARTPVAEITSGTINGGCGILSFQYKQVFSTGVSLDVFVNGLLVKTVTSSGQQGVVLESGDITVNQSGGFVLDLKQTSTNSGQVAIDNIQWTASSGGPLPEPSDYPTLFAAAAGPYKVTLSWTDAAGTQPPTAYLVKASISSTITDPVDGVPVADDPDLSDGVATVNVLQGGQGYLFTGLPINTQYFFKVYPYTNTGANINFKTDGTVPSANATTPNLTIINSAYFDDFSFDNWTPYSVTGDQVWVIDSIHGFSPQACAKISGYAGGNFENEDWLISPKLDFTHSTNQMFSFMSAYNYTGNLIEVKISTDFNGDSDPNTATWTNLTATLSPGGWAYTASGDIDVSAFTGNNVYIAFKYTSTASASTTWELDNLLVTGVAPAAVHETGRNEFNIYPNPTQGMIRLEFNKPAERQIEILSVVGNTVLSKTTDRSSAQFDLSNLPKGIYLVRISDDNGSNPAIKKVILK